jgi:hypothetical protein
MTFVPELIEDTELAVKAISVESAIEADYWKQDDISDLVYQTVVTGDADNAVTVECINICTLIEEVLFAHVENIWLNYQYEAAEAATAAFAEANDCAIYSACREDFNFYDAARKAVAEGKTRVICEDLS